jgi:hypothetical protein
LIKNSDRSKANLVLLFDEAQCLVGPDGFGFRVIRWWLRLNHGKKVVAVFAGTTSKLASFYKDYPPTTEASRDAAAVYSNYTAGDPNNPRKSYDPFFRICTIGCYHNEFLSQNSADASDFQNAAYFGRPLFAYLAKQKTLVRDNDKSVTRTGAVKLTNTKLHAILKRMLALASPTTEWKGSKTALCSILGSRVQMGITTSFAMASELVSHAYAHLVDFHPNDDGKIDKAVARVCFMPDPVCAALAMGMMTKGWKLTNGEDASALVGEHATFWSEEAMKLLRSGLCLPEKGDSGEIMAALYMLFCGDVLRYAADNSMRTFSVPLLDWYAAMRGDHNHPTAAMAPINNKQGDDETAETMQPDSPKKRKLATDERRFILSRKCRALQGKPKTEQVEFKESESKQGDFNMITSMDVNFIQVCRNYLQGHSWKTQRGLEWMYNSCTAIYVYPDCEAIDMVAAIRVEGNGTPFYHPMLVSVKCWMSMSPAEINCAMTNIDTLLRTVRANQDENSKCPRALCLVLLIGALGIY